MSNINVTQLKQRFTEEMAAKYSERAVPKAYLQSFYTVVEKNTRYLNYEVKKYDESVAIDIVRGTESNMNKFSLEDNKIIDPPVFGEMFGATEMRSYETSWGSSNYSATAIASFMEEVIERMGVIQDKIDRAKELQCAQVLDTGIITLVNGDNLNFQRKAASMVDNVADGGVYWDSAPTTATPVADVEKMFIFARTVGRAQGGNARLIMGRRAFNAFIKTDEFKTRAGWMNTKLDDVKGQERNSVGASYHGRADFGSWTADIWTYPEYYKNSSGVMVPYIDDRKIHLLGENIKFVMGHAGLPTLPPDGLPGFAESAKKQTKGSYIINEYIDRLKKAWLFEMCSSFVAMPVQINGFASRTVCAAE